MHVVLQRNWPALGHTARPQRKTLSQVGRYVQLKRICKAARPRLVLLVQPLVWPWLRLHLPIGCAFTVFCALVWALKRRLNP